MDAKDRLILSIIQEDSTFSVKEISERIGLTFTPTYERIKQLEKQGVIEKYVGILNREKLGLNLVVYCNIRLKEQWAELSKFYNVSFFDHQAFLNSIGRAREA